MEHFVACDAHGIPIMEIDFAWPRHRIALHGDSFEFHTSFKAFQDDLAKRARLAAAGWSNLSVGWSTLDKHTWSDGLKHMLSQRAS